MRRQINLTTRRDLTSAISQRYQAADRNGKKCEFSARVRDVI